MIDAHPKDHDTARRCLAGSRVAAGRHRGFSLIELMVVVAVAGLLAAVALPSYRNYVVRGHRAAARAQLAQAAQYMQRFYAANDRYDADRSGTSVWNIMPAALMRSPAEGTQQYEMAATGSSGKSTAGSGEFLLVMRPVGTGAMAGDACGGFTMTQTGERGITASTTPATVAECWR